MDDRGSARLKTLTMFAKKMADFSDDGVLVNGAYGYRWTEWFGRDQLSTVIDLLRKNPLDRRACSDVGLYSRPWFFIQGRSL